MFRHRMRDMFVFEAPDAGAGHPGVTTGEEAAEFDLTTQEGFDRSLAAKLGKTLPEDYSGGQSTTISEGLTFGEEPERPRDELGRYAPFDQEAPEAPAPTTPAAPEAPAPTQEEQELSLAQQLANAQELIGRQGLELGELRQAVQQVQQAPQSPQGPPPEIPYMTQEQAEQVYEWVDKTGFRQTMMWALENRPDLHDTILQAGRDMDLPEARDYEINLRVQEALMARDAQAPQQQRDPYVVKQEQGETMKSVITKVKGETEDFAALQGHINKAVEDQPLLADLIASGDAQQMEHGLRLAVGVARGYAATELAAAAAAEASKRGAGREQVKLAAQVATGSARVGTGGEAPAGIPTEQEKAEAIAEFKKGIFDAPGTSVADGLTFG